MKVLAVSYGSPEFLQFAHLEWPHGFNKSSTESAEAILYYLAPERQFFKHGQGQAFLLVDESGVAQGRVYASVDDLVSSQKGDKIGYFGFLICDSQTASIKLLLDAAANWCRERGCGKIWGPVNLNIYVGYRLQIFGQEKQGFLGEPRSPQYLVDRLTELSYAPIAKWNSWDIPTWRVSLNALRLQIKRFTQVLLLKKQTCRAVGFDMSRIQTHLQEIYVLFMKTFNKNFLFTQISFEEFSEYFTMLAQMLDASSPLILNEKDQVVGFAFNYPHPSLLDGKRTLVMHTMCIEYEYRKLGVVDLMGEFVSARLPGRYDQVIGALAKEGRTAYDRSGPPARGYAVFSMDLKR